MGSMTGNWLEPHAARDQDQRGIGQPRAGDAGQGVGEAGSGRDHGHRGFAVHPGPGLGHEDRRLFVARIEDGHPGIFEELVDGGDMPAAEGKDVIHIAFDQGLRDELAADDVAHRISS